MTREDAKKLLDGVTLTRQSVAARIVELYDPIGVMEPLKLQLKLQLSKLNRRDWKIPLNPDEQAEWRTLLVQFVDYHSIRILDVSSLLELDLETLDWYALLMLPSLLEVQLFMLVQKLLQVIIPLH